jgi:1-pyrroline-5-carboxylate dehydrogenase
VRIGDIADFSNFMGAVIDKSSFENIRGYIGSAKASPDYEVVFGGGCHSERGYFVEPTVLLTRNPMAQTMCEEIFGPVLTIYVYEDAKVDEALALCDQTSPYALTGAVFARDRQFLEKATQALENAAGNFYINTKPTGAVVGQQPFGGARGSGTNDKAGSIFNLIRWVSMRTLSETFVPPTSFRYPFLGPASDTIR